MLSLKNNFTSCSMLEVLHLLLTKEVFAKMLSLHHSKPAKVEKKKNSKPNFCEGLTQK